MGEGVGLGLSIAFTWSRFSRVTRPRRRYQIPSPVSHASSALIVVPSVSRIVTGPRFAASALVDTGFLLSSTRAGSALTFGVGVGVGLGEGDGEGDTLADGDAIKGGGGEITCCVKDWFADDWFEF